MRRPNWLYNRINRRSHLPRWVRWIWRMAHWCPEMDELLVIDNVGDCFCGHAWQTCPSCRKKRPECDFVGRVCSDCEVVE